MIDKQENELEILVNHRDRNREDQVIIEEEEEETADDKKESGLIIENKQETDQNVFEDGLLAEMYKRIENGNEDCAPGWSRDIGYYKNR